MLSEEKLSEYFLEDGTPNWEKYCESFKRAYPSDWDFSTMNMSQREEAVFNRTVLRFVDYEYSKKGFLERGKGYRLSNNEGCPMFFGGLLGEGLFFASKQDADKVIDIIGFRGISVKEVL